MVSSGLPQPKPGKPRRTQMPEAVSKTPFSTVWLMVVTSEANHAAFKCESWIGWDWFEEDKVILIIRGDKDFHQRDSEACAVDLLGRKNGEQKN